MGLDVVVQRRRMAHMRAAINHDQSAEFHRAVAEHFESLRDDLNATRARQLAEDHCQRASRERDYASLWPRTSSSVAA
jgi:hypothetical protein